MGKPKILCIHAFRISSKIFLQMLTTYWSPEILDRLDLHFVDAPYPAQGPSAVKNLPQFPPPYYEWFQSTEFVMLIGASKFGYKTFGTPKLAVNAYSTPIKLPSLHFIGDKDFLREENLALLDAYVNPVVIRHNQDHRVPRLG
ncbi:Serine hydrolase FSH [Melia azedarach]|uniref:Serine hydrolase FSH n=1 Tax=Melia azedarach TaxID=155640 RepID=A0ACC1XSS4_MELAZ|nr:Serine hydrolase FSH [Melia azedarach]